MAVSDFLTLACITPPASVLGTWIWIKVRKQQIKAKFANMGILTGKTEAEILAVVGPPKLMFGGPGPGQKRLAWSYYGYSITLIFTNGVCDGVASEVNV